MSKTSSFLRIDSTEDLESLPPGLRAKEAPKAVRCPIGAPPGLPEPSVLLFASVPPWSVVEALQKQSTVMALVVFIVAHVMHMDAGAVSLAVKRLAKLVKRPEEREAKVATKSLQLRLREVGLLEGEELKTLGRLSVLGATLEQEDLAVLDSALDRAQDKLPSLALGEAVQLLWSFAKLTSELEKASMVPPRLMKLFNLFAETRASEVHLLPPSGLYGLSWSFLRATSKSVPMEQVQLFRALARQAQQVPVVAGHSQGAGSMIRCLCSVHSCLPSEDLRVALERLADVICAEDVGELSVGLLGSTLAFLGRSGVKHHWLFDCVQQHKFNKANLCTPQAILELARPVALVGRFSSEGFQEVLSAWRLHCQEFQPKQHIELLHVLARSGIGRFHGGALPSQMLEQLPKWLQAERLGRQAEVAWSLSRFETYPAAAMLSIAAAVVTDLRTLSGRDLSNLVWALGKADKAVFKDHSGSKELWAALLQELQWRLHEMSLQETKAALLGCLFAKRVNEPLLQAAKEATARRNGGRGAREDVMPILSQLQRLSR